MTVKETSYRCTGQPAASELFSCNTSVTVCLKSDTKNMLQEAPVAFVLGLGRFSVDYNLKHKHSKHSLACQHEFMMQLLRFWIYFDTIPHAVAWLSCAGFVFGKPTCHLF